MVVAPKSGRARAEADRRRIFEGLRDAIAAGTFGRSGRLPTERALAEQFATNRNTIRKALDDLAALGLIERHVGRGTFVADDAAPGDSGAPDYPLTELLEARLLFEPHLAALVVERATDEDFALMEAYLAELRGAKSWAEFKEAKYCLHLMIVRSAGNSFLTAMFEQIIESRRRAMWGRPGDHPAPIAEVREVAASVNGAIVAALRAGEVERARELIRRYLLDVLSTTSQS
ncbi:hypothetical protein OG2516_12754 [Oceanicola granulosus HTCC2516]|uniref:HTH gntR-type domain-containing protein n=2 Tax=Oceanicola granulosus TaxID=252302 RepID=Q2CC30_OCEGH|nr:hypothetical protein OG2516_12754 [Oceanicola granulosus HTCC2516]